METDLDRLVALMGAATPAADEGPVPWSGFTGILAGYCQELDLPAMVVQFGSTGRDVSSASSRILGCTRVPQLTVRPERYDGSAALIVAVLAHEAAHVTFGHIKVMRRRRLRLVLLGLAAFAAAWVPYFAHWTTYATLAGCWPFLFPVLITLGGPAVVNWWNRRDELDADREGTRMLNRAGLPGAELMSQSLTRGHRDLESVAWLLRIPVWSHPTLVRRLAAIAEVGQLEGQ